MRPSRKAPNKAIHHWEEQTLTSHVTDQEDDDDDDYPEWEFDPNDAQVVEHNHKGTLDPGKLEKQVLTKPEADSDTESDDEGALIHEEINTTLQSRSNASQFQRLWHARLGHPSDPVMKAVAQQSDIKDAESLIDSKIGKTNCLSCAQGKGCAQPATSKYRKKIYGDRKIKFLEIVHSDTCGPITPVSYPRKNKYFQIYVEGKSMYTTLVLLKNKTEGFPKFKQYRKTVERATGHKMKWFKSDNGTEFKNSATKKYFRQKGIRHMTSAAYRPQANGKSERVLRRIIELAKSMMYTAGSPSYLWDYAFEYGCYIHNRLPSGALNYKTPYYMWNKFHPSHKRLRVWGCNTTVRIPKEKRKKLGAAAFLGCFVGIIGDDSGKYVVYVPSLRKTLISSDVLFDEANFSVISKNSGVTPNGVSYETTDLCSTNKVATIHIPDDESSASESDDDDSNSEDGRANRPATSSDDSNSDSDSSSSSDSDSSPDENEPEVAGNSDQDGDRDNHDDDEGALSPGHSQNHDEVFTRNSQGNRSSTRTTKGRPAIRYDEEGYVTKVIGSNKNAEKIYLTPEAYIHQDVLEIIESSNTPHVNTMVDNPDTYTFEQAIHHDVNGDNWKKAVKEELDSMEKMQVWTPVMELPKGKKAIGMCWVFKHKLLPDGTIARFKARVVAKGYTQRKSIDYNETYASVAKFPSIRLFFALAATKGWEVHQMDAKTAFLCAPIDTEVYVSVPPGLTTHGRYLKLKKGLYGLKQSPRLWQKRLTDYLIKVGFERSEYDHSIYIKKDMIIAVYVDDILCSGASPSIIEEFKDTMKSEFEMTDGGISSFFLNIQIKTIRGDRKDKQGNVVKNAIIAYHLTQEHYAKKILKQYDMAGCAEAPTPIAALLPKKTENEQPADVGLYQACIGSLMYLMLGTRPDIAFAVSHLSSFCANPAERHWHAVKRVLR